MFWSPQPINLHLILNLRLHGFISKRVWRNLWRKYAETLLKDVLRYQSEIYLREASMQCHSFNIQKPEKICWNTVSPASTQVSDYCRSKKREPSFPYETPFDSLFPPGAGCGRIEEDLVTCVGPFELPMSLIDLFEARCNICFWTIAEKLIEEPW